MLKYNCSANVFEASRIWPFGAGSGGHQYFYIVKGQAVL